MNGFCSKKSREPLQRFIETFFPHPVRYRRVWSQRIMPPIHVWEPIPPAPEFIALGMVVTSEDAEPSLQEVHCVPRPWVQRLPTPGAQQIWTCPGAAPAVSLWGAAASN